MAKRTKKSYVEPVDELEIETRPEKKVTKMASNTSTDSILELDMNLEDFGDYQPLPKSAYPAEVVQAELRMSDKGNEYYYVVFNIHPDDYPADYAVENAPEGARLTYARMQKPTPKNLRSITAVKNFYRALGLNMKTSKINPGDWEGKKAKLVLDVGEYNGSPVNNIVAIEALD